MCLGSVFHAHLLKLHSEKKIWQKFQDKYANHCHAVDCEDRVDGYIEPLRFNQLLPARIGTKAARRAKISR